MHSFHRLWMGQCITSEVFGSKRCDCKEQLEMALDQVSSKQPRLTQAAGR